MSRIVFSFMVLCLSAIVSAAPTMKDGILGVALDGIWSASEVFVLYMIGAIITYRVSMYLIHKFLADFQMSQHRVQDIFRLLEIYIKSAFIPAIYGVLAHSVLKLDRSFVLYECCNEYITLITCGVLFLLLIYTLLLPAHENFDVLRINKSDSIKIYKSFSRIFISTTGTYCFLVLTDAMSGLDYLIVDMVCRSILVVHYLSEIFVLKETIHSISLRRRIAYIGMVSHFVQYINKRWWIVSSAAIFGLYVFYISDAHPHFEKFVYNNAIIFFTLLITQLIAIHVLEFATSLSLRINTMDVGHWSNRFKRHVYITANVAVSVLYFISTYTLFAYIFGNPVEFFLKTGVIYTTLKAAIQVYIVFFVYKCVDLFLSYKSECWYFEKGNRAKTLRSVLPIAVIAVKCLVVGIGIMIVLANYNVNLTPVYTAILGLGVPISLAAKGTVTSFIQGFMMLLEDDLEIGNCVTVAGVRGIVEDIGIRTVKIRDFSGTLHVIQYANIGVISNSSKDYTSHYMEIYCPPDVNINEFIKILHEVLAETQKMPDIQPSLLLKRDFNFIGIKGFDENGIKFAWSYSTKPDIVGHFYDVFCDILMKRLSEKGMPFPKCLDKGIHVNWNAYLNKTN